MVASEHLEVIDGRHLFIATGVLGYEEVYEDGSIDNDVAALDEEDESGSGEAGLKTSVIQSGT